MSEPPSPPFYPQQQRHPEPPPGWYGQSPGQPPRQPPGQPSRQPARRPQHRPDTETVNQVRAAYDARVELGPEYEDAVAAGLAERVEELVAYRTAELRNADQGSKEERADERSRETHRFVLGIISLGSGIPITAIAATNVEPGLLGVLAAWAGIVGVNTIFAWGNRRRSRE